METDIRVVKTEAAKNMQEIVLEIKELNEEHPPHQISLDFHSVFKH